jgi:EAL domain-containing protein (putative c-di-GMP-specific phosphodiesterase class I)
MTRHSRQPVARGSLAATRPRILVVDCEEAARRAVVGWLKFGGFEPVEAADRLQAVRLLDDGMFDAVVTAALLPGMNGIDLLRAARERDFDMPVLVISGAAGADRGVEAVRYGATECLIKPFELSFLETRVRRAVDLHRLAKERRRALRLLESGRPEPGDRAGLEVALNRALDSLWVAYQPIMNASTHEVFGYEALLRSDESALPHPGAVLDAAERLDRLEAVGRAVRNKAPEPMSCVPPSTLLFVNLHARELTDETLASPSSPLGSIASRVVLEITERASLDEVEDVRGTVARLREMGFRIAIDDFGAGYPGLSSFAQLEPEFVKLDMTFVRGIHQDAVKQKLVQSVGRLCQDMGIVVAAEGIEVPEERNSLVDLGCDLLQGYLFARPGRPFPAVSW